MSLYIYPKLPAKFEFIYRFFGSGLGNCLFIYSRALILSKKYNAKIIRPTWEQFKIGPVLRGENDKRFYKNIFRNSEISGYKKYRILLINKLINEDDFTDEIAKGIIKVEGLKDFFRSLQGHNYYLRGTLLKKINPELVSKFKNYKKRLENTVAIHVRRGDYPQTLRTSDRWFVDVINALKKINPTQKFVIFSDAPPDQLQNILKINNVEYINSGNALIDIFLLGESKLIIGSNSTFSPWGAFLGNIPIILESRHFPPIYDDMTKELTMENVNNRDLSMFCERYI